MIITRAGLALAIALALAAPGAPAAPLDGAATYDLLFRDGTLDPLRRDHALVYRREVINALNFAAAARDSGEIVLRIEAAEDMEMARLAFRQGDRRRGMGAFPASVGNPMIMLFYESVVRDMAETTGGSPFYIRNRVKEALTRPSEVEAGTATVGGAQVPTRTVRLHPFAGDPNAARMMGFGDLELRVTMSHAVPGWYLSLVAEVPGRDGPVYRSGLNFEREEPLP